VGRNCAKLASDPRQVIALGRQIPKTIRHVEEPRLIHHPCDHGSIKQSE
jgi:hypothetical protein